MRKIILRALFAATITIFSSSAFANVTNFDQSQFRGWLIEFAKDAEKQGIGSETIYQFLKNAEFLPRVIELDRRQPHATKTFAEYIQTVIPESRINKARKEIKENQKILDKVSKKYNVQPRFIISLWAIESDFGRNMGGFSIVNSLATLAYEGRRAEFFRKELVNALKIIDDGHVDFDHMKGSWAGAMGQTQFMPSSFLELAVDENNDGKRDIWGTREDAFASIANYLSKRGWDNDTTWGREVQLPSSFDDKLLGRETEKNLEEWRKIGVKNINGAPLPRGRSDLKASVIKLEDGKGRAFLVYSNYNTILKWNRSLYFATAVGLISDSIK